MKIIKKEKEIEIFPDDYGLSKDFDEALAAVAFMISTGKCKGGVFQFIDWDYWDGLYSKFESRDCEIRIPGINRDETGAKYKERLIGWLDNIVKFATIVPRDEKTIPHFVLW